MRYRRLDENWDYVFGQGRGCYLTGVEAVAQAVRSRLQLFLGEWWEDTGDGLPMWQRILGSSPGLGNNQTVIDRLIQERILGTPHVTDVKNVASQYDPSDRSYSFQCTIDTEYGSTAFTL